MSTPDLVFSILLLMLNSTTCGGAAITAARQFKEGRDMLAALNASLAVITFSAVLLSVIYLAK